MIVNKKHRVPGIYVIRNMVNNKLYVGKSKNIYHRIMGHISALNSKSLNENQLLVRAWHKYTRENFEYFVVEYCELDDKLLSNRELYWMTIFKSLNRNFGYNLRSDSDTQCVVHEDTRKLISKNMKEKWATGAMKDHGKKLAKNWKDNNIRKKEQSELFCKTKTKYKYIIMKDDIILEECNYKRLKELKLDNVQAIFFTKTSDKVNHKGYTIERLKI